jgi:HK97 gp10 family phage protein
VSAPRFKVQYDLNLTELERLKNYGIRKAMRIAVNRAAAGMKAAVVAEAQRIALTGATAKSARIKVKVYRQFTFVTLVGPARGFTMKGAKITRGRKAKVPFRRGLRKEIRPGRYAHLVEFGTKRSKAKPFILRAERASAPQFRRTVTQEIAREIEKELGRAR